MGHREWVRSHKGVIKEVFVVRVCCEGMCWYESMCQGAP